MNCAVSLNASDLVNFTPPAAARASALHPLAAPTSLPLTSHDPSHDPSRSNAGPCPFPLRVVALGDGGADAAALLAPSPMIAIQAELALTPQSIRELVMLGPDVVVIDLRGTPLAYVAPQLRRIHGASARSRIVALVADEAYAQQALLGGATACIGASDDPVAVLRAVHDAARNRLHLGGAARQVLRRALPDMMTA